MYLFVLIFLGFGINHGIEQIARMLAGERASIYVCVCVCVLRKNCANANCARTRVAEKWSENERIEDELSVEALAEERPIEKEMATRREFKAKQMVKETVLISAKAKNVRKVILYEYIHTLNRERTSERTRTRGFR